MPEIAMIISIRLSIKQKMKIYWLSLIHLELEYVSIHTYLAIFQRKDYLLTNHSKLINVLFVEPKSKEALRNSRGLNRFIYIACAPKAAMQNWIDFSRPCSKTLKGEPFVLKEAAAVDMFPHTSHVEMVLLFERLVTPPKTNEQSSENSKSNEQGTEISKSNEQNSETSKSNGQSSETTQT